MSGEGMPKRNRDDMAEQRPARPVAEVVEVPDSPPTSPIATPPQHNDLLEQQLDALEVDDDFRESIRAMTPDTQRDVLNDIIRHQQHSELEAGLQGFGGQAGFVHPFNMFEGEIGEGHEGGEDDSEPQDWEDEAEEGAEAEDDVVQRDARGHGAPPFLFRGAPFMMGQRVQTPGEDDDDMGRPRMHAFGERDGGGPMSIVDFLQFVTQHVGAEPMLMPGMPGRAADQQQQRQQQQQARNPLEERMRALQNLFGMLQQATAMESMGLHRDVDEMSYEELLELEERIGNVSKGVPPAQLESCMRRVAAAPADETCPICQEELRVTGTSGTTGGPSKGCVKLLNCPHVFHKSCIKQWLANNKTCPVCKQEVLPQSGASAS